MTQRYSDKLAQDRMEQRLCPECGRDPEVHSSEPRFWVHFDRCSLLPKGAQDRIIQHLADVNGS